MRVIRSALVLALVAPLATVAAAEARVVKAVTILPPGQSGVVTSPHVFDQLPLFQQLEYKPAPLGGGAGGAAPERPRAGLSIRRDRFGVPAIRARSDNEAWWGAGYSVAPNPATWRDERATVSPEAQGVATPPDIPLLNRGTYEMAVELGR